MTDKVCDTPKEFEPDNRLEDYLGDEQACLAQDPYNYATRSCDLAVSAMDQCSVEGPDYYGPQGASLAHAESTLLISHDVSETSNQPNRFLAALDPSTRQKLVGLLELSPVVQAGRLISKGYEAYKGSETEEYVSGLVEAIVPEEVSVEAVTEALTRGADYVFGPEPQETKASDSEALVYYEEDPYDYDFEFGDDMYDDLMCYDTIDEFDIFEEEELWCSVDDGLEADGFEEGEDAQKIAEAKGQAEPTHEAEEEEGELLFPFLMFSAHTEVSQQPAAYSSYYSAGSYSPPVVVAASKDKEEPAPTSFPIEEEDGVAQLLINEEGYEAAGSESSDNPGSVASNQELDVENLVDEPADEITAEGVQASVVVEEDVVLPEEPEVLTAANDFVEGHNGFVSKHSAVGQQGENSSAIREDRTLTNGEAGKAVARPFPEAVSSSVGQPNEVSSFSSQDGLEINRSTVADEGGVRRLTRSYNEESFSAIGPVPFAVISGSALFFRNQATRGDKNAEMFLGQIVVHAGMLACFTARNQQARVRAEKSLFEVACTRQFYTVSGNQGAMGQGTHQEGNSHSQAEWVDYNDSAQQIAFINGQADQHEANMPDLPYRIPVDVMV